MLPAVPTAMHFMVLVPIAMALVTPFIKVMMIAFGDERKPATAKAGAK
jgi:hypothetical protein